MNARVDAHNERLIGFSSRLRGLIIQRGLVMVPAQLARELTFSTGEQCVTAQTMSNWLNGVQMPRGEPTMRALAKWLHTTPEYLADGTPLLHFAPAVCGDVDEQQVVDQFRTLNAYGKRVIKDLLRSMVRMNKGAA